MNEVGQVSQWVTSFLPNALAALAILLVGWIVAVFVSGVVKKGVSKTKAGTSLAGWLKGDEKAEPIEVSKWAGAAAYYFVMLFVLAAFFQYLGLTFVAEPLRGFLNQAFAYIPRLIGAGVLILVAWIVATVLKRVIVTVLSKAKLEERLGEDDIDTEKKGSMVESFAMVIYWLVFLLFFPAILSTLALEGLLIPVQDMFIVLLSFLPNILGAVLIFAFAWLVARILQRLTTHIVSAVGVDRIGESANVSSVLGEQTISKLVGILVYTFVMVIGIIAALNALALEAITAPASQMLEMILSAIPAVFAAVLVWGIAYLIGRIIAGLVTGVLSSIGFDNILERLGLTKEPQEGLKTPSEMAGYLVLIAVMLLAAIEASGLLGFVLVADLIVRFIVILGQVAIGLVIFGLGLYLAGLAHEAVMSSGGPQAGLLARLAKIAILVLAGTMALSHMGAAQEIIFISFAVILGAIALTAVIAFGVGGRDIASRELDEIVKKLKEKE